MKLILNSDTALRKVADLRVGDVISENGWEFEIPHLPILMPDNLSMRVDMKSLASGIRTHGFFDRDQFVEILCAPAFKASEVSPLSAPLGSMCSALDEWSPSEGAA